MIITLPTIFNLLDQIIHKKIWRERCHTFDFPKKKKSFKESRNHKSLSYIKILFRLPSLSSNAKNWLAYMIKIWMWRTTIICHLWLKCGYGELQSFAIMMDSRPCIICHRNQAITWIRHFSGAYFKRFLISQTMTCLSLYPQGLRHSGWYITL